MKLRSIILIGLLFALWQMGTTKIEAAACAMPTINNTLNCQVATTHVPTFVNPEPSTTGLIDRNYYAYIEDNAIVYAEASFNAPQVRNVGVGFLYATVIGWHKVNDVTWYQINRGEYLPESSIRLVDAAQFQGVEVKQQPVRPFGWLVQDGFPSSAPGIEPDLEGTTKLKRYTFFEAYESVLADDGWIWYNIGGGQWIPQTFVSLLDVTPRPAEVGEDEFWVEVDLYEQTLAAYEGDQMVYATLISSGLNRWPTREGVYQVFERFEQYKMSGAEGRVDYYYLEDVPYIMYFDQLMGIGLHGTFWHDRFGYKHSHGCVNMSIRDAEWVFNWSADIETALWVSVWTSDPLLAIENDA